MTHFGFPAMGTRIDAWGHPDSQKALRSWFERVEDVCSRFRPGSELSRLNDSSSATVAIDGILRAVIEAGSTALDLSGGLVNIGVGSAVRDWGYDRSYEMVTDLDDRPTTIRHNDWGLDHGLVHRTPDMSFDLGGIAKGWSCDRAVTTGLADVVSAGGDLRSRHPDTTASVLDSAGQIAARVHVGIGALATSSVGKRRWRVGGAEVSHLIDPRTMEPVDTPVHSATVLADTAVEAETAAKTVLLLGTDGLAWASEQPWIAAALVIWHDGSVFGTPGLKVAA